MSKSIVIKEKNMGIILAIIKKLYELNYDFKDDKINLENDEIDIVENSYKSVKRFKFPDGCNMAVSLFFYGSKKDIYDGKITGVFYGLNIFRVSVHIKGKITDNLISNFYNIHKNYKTISKLIYKIIILNRDDNCSGDENFTSKYYGDNIFSPRIVQILNYKNVIETLNEISLKEQVEFIEKLNELMERQITYRYRNFVFKKVDNHVIYFSFLRIPLGAIALNDLNLYRYFRHRGLSFFANYIKKYNLFDNLVSNINKVNLKINIL